MKHIKSYKELNEELTSNQRTWLHLPYLLPGILLKRFLGITTLLNYKWSEIKKKTEDSKFEPLLATSSNQISKMKRNINKITLKDLPENKLGFSTFLRTWNLYLVEGDKHSDSSSKDPKRQRPIVYLSKDEIKTGDFFCGERVSDTDIYSDFKMGKKDGKKEPEDLSKFPIIIMIAKADKAEETIDISKYIEDICLELKDDLPVEVRIDFNKIGDNLCLNIVSLESFDLFYSDDLDKKVEDIRKNIESYLQSQGYKLKGKVYYKLLGNLWYFGHGGRFDEIRRIGKYDDSKNRDRGYEQCRVSPNNAVNVKSISNMDTIYLGKKSKEFGTDKYPFYIDSGDIKVLLNDKDKCSNNSYTRPAPLVKGMLNSRDGENIQLRSILIEFGK